MIHDFSERRHGADFDTVAASSANSAQFADSTQVDHNLRFLIRSFSQSKLSRPPPAPRHRSVLFEKSLRIVDGRRLKQSKAAITFV